MKICAISDLHGNLLTVPACDLLLIGGDIVPLAFQNNHKLTTNWLDTDFRTWLKTQQAKHIVGIAGNHDKTFEELPEILPKDLPWHYLQDSGIVIEGLKIWGTPWQPTFGWWSFNLYEHDLRKKWELIPKDTDILIVHGPPYMHGDLTYDDIHTGSPSLYEKIKNINIRLTVTGHIHESYGISYIDKTIIVNASLMDFNYEPVNKPVLIETDGWKILDNK